jgi:hypothetical protein
MSRSPQQQPPKGNPMQDYVTVAERIEKFYERFPEGRIITHIVEHDAERGFILMRAEIYRQPDDAQPSATGHAYEYRDAGYVQKTSYIEVGETSAVGRALALCGLETKRGMTPRQVNPAPVTKPAPVANLKEAPATEGETAERDWHMEVSIIWKQLRALGLAEFQDGDAMIKHFQDTAKAKKWDPSLYDLERISNAPTPIARSYAGILSELYKANQKTI